MSKKLKTATASWSISLNVECPNPKCEYYMDLWDNKDFQWDEGYPFKAAESYQLPDKDGRKASYNEELNEYNSKFICPKCEQEFQLTEIYF